MRPRTHCISGFCFVNLLEFSPLHLLMKMPNMRSFFKFLIIHATRFYIHLCVLIFVSICFNNSLKAQSTNPGINFQAIARDIAHNTANNRKIYVQADIEKGVANGVVVYGENQITNSNEFGVFNIVIGKGVRYIGATDLYSIDWLHGPYFIHLKIVIAPVTPSIDWDYTKEWIDLGSVEFGVVPFALQSFSSGSATLDTTVLSKKLNAADTVNMLSPYAYKIDIASLNLNNTLKVNYADTLTMLAPYRKLFSSNDAMTTKIEQLSKSMDTSSLSSRIQTKLNIADTAAMLNGYLRSPSLSAGLLLKLDLSDTSTMLNTRFARDTVNLSNRIVLKEDLANKSTDMSAVADYGDTKYPTVKAIKNYVDAAVTAGASDASTNNKGIVQLAGDFTGTALLPLINSNAVTTSKIQDAAVTDAKIAMGVSASKVGLGNVTNNAQLYSLNGLTAQVQGFGTIGTSGLSANWVSSGNSHVLNIPMASATAVTAGLISKLDYDRFSNGVNNSITTLTNNGNAGVATINGQTLNIPDYNLIGLAGNVNANSIFAGPISGGVASASFRNLVAADIPNNASNTSGNAATASKLATPRYINNVLFDGSADVANLSATTTNALSFSNAGAGVSAGSSFNGSSAKEISYNTIGAAPTNGSTSITTLGSINTGTWAASVIGSNYGGAGNNNGILKANGAGLVNTAIAGTDYMAPFGVQTAKYIYAAPNATNGNPVFRLLVASDIPTLNQNTTGNASTATALASVVNINGVAFNGLSDITIAANTTNNVNFNDAGTGLNSPVTFNGSSAKTISYNTIGAAPSMGSNSITTLGNITTGTWSANIIGANYGGAGTNNGILMANGAGLVSSAIAGSDYQAPLNFASPLVNTTNTISLPQANTNNSGYLTNTDWTSFNNKIDGILKGAHNGVASLDANGKIPTSQIPAISFSSGYVVTSESAMLALSTAAVGSIAIRTDNSKNYVLSSLPASTLGNWLELLMPVSVSSVNGHTESNITLTSSDIAEGTNLYFTNARARNAISVVSPLSYTTSTGVLSMTAATSNNAGYISAADWNTFNNKMSTFSTQAPNSFYAGPTSGINASPVFRTIVAADIPVLNQNTTGNAATATKLATSKNINGIAFDGSSDITIASTIANAITFNTSGLGATSPVNFDGSIAKTISYNSIGAAPAAGSTSITSLGTVTTGTWLGNTIDASHGGAGLTNGILKADGSGNVSAAVAGTDFITPFGSQTSKYFYAAPNAANGAPVFRAILATDIPVLNQATTANAGTATKLAATKNINGVAFDGTADITITAAVPNAVTFDNSGLGVSTGNTFNGSAAKTISYNTIGAAPIAGSTSITTLGTVTAGTWSANVIDANHGGAGAVNGILKANGSGVVTAATAGSDFENPLTFSLPLTRATNTIALPAATTSTNGYVTSTDWNTFNNKQATILAGTGVTITGGNTVSIGQSVATTASPVFSGATLSGLNVAGIVINSASGVLSTASTTGTGNIVRATSPVLITPSLGDASATSINVSGDVTAKRFKLTMPTAITAAATTTIDLSTGNVFTVNMGLNVTTFNLTNPVVGTYLIKFVQDATGTRDVTFPAAWKWAGGVAPSLTNTANKLDIVTLIYDGTTFYATIVQNF